MEAEYKIPISDGVAAQLEGSIRERDEFARAAQEKLNLLASGVDKQVSIIIAMGGHDDKAPRGNVTIPQPGPDGKRYLAVSPPAGPREAIVPQAPEQVKGFRPGKHSKANGTPVPAAETVSGA